MKLWYVEVETCEDEFDTCLKGLLVAAKDKSQLKRLVVQKGEPHWSIEHCRHVGEALTPVQFDVVCTLA